MKKVSNKKHYNKWHPIKAVTLVQIILLDNGNEVFEWEKKSEILGKGVAYGTSLEIRSSPLRIPWYKLKPLMIKKWEKRGAQND